MVTSKAKLKAKKPKAKVVKPKAKAVKSKAKSAKPKLKCTERKYNDIVRAAKKLFLKYGLNDVTMDDVSEKAKVSKRTLYRHFPSKDELIEFTIKKHWNELALKLPDEVNDNMPPREALREFAMSCLEFLCHPDTLALVRFTFECGKKYALLTKSLARGEINLARGVLNHYLVSQNDKGVLRIKDINLASRQFIGMVREYNFNAMLTRYDDLIPPREQADSIDAAIDVFLNYYEVKYI